MDKDIYYIVTESGAPAIEEIPALGARAAVVCEWPNLAEGGETLETVNLGDLALLDARADVRYAHVKTPGGTRTIDNSEFLGDAVSNLPRRRPHRARRRLALGSPALFA